MAERDPLPGSDPILLAQRWFAEAIEAGERQPEATVLSTVGPDGRPSSRAVLVRGLDEDGVVFHTNRQSRKGRELAQNPHAAMCSTWHTLHRQLRIEGTVAPASDAVSDAYWAARPVGSRASAAASPQSEAITSREHLEGLVADVEEANPDGAPRPAHWGGYVLVPDRLEFWIGRRDRLHDRILFTRRADGTWERSLLAP